MSERVKTHIGGLDDQLNGGVPFGRVVLISGTPGTMKSSITYNILYQNALRDGINGVYITLDESKDSLIEQMKSLGFDHSKVEDKVTIVDMAYLRKNLEHSDDETSWMDIFKMYAEKMKQTLDYKILVVDSLRVLETLSKVGDVRTELFFFFEWLRDMKVNSFLISEVSPDPRYLYDGDFLADGVIRLIKERVGLVDTHRYLVVDKMRGTKHNTGYFTLLFENGEFQITRAISEI